MPDEGQPHDPEASHEGTVLDEAEAAGRSEPAGVRIRVLERIEEAVASLLVLMILLLVSMQVVNRVAGIGGYVWTGELARFGLVWLTFFLVGGLLAQDRHISLHLIDIVLSDRALAAVKVLASLVVLAISIAMMVESWALISDQSGQGSPAMGMPLTWVYSVPFLGFGLTALRAVLVLVRPRGRP